MWLIEVKARVQTVLGTAQELYMASSKLGNTHYLPPPSSPYPAPFSLLPHLLIPYPSPEITNPVQTEDIGILEIRILPYTYILLIELFF